MKTPNEKKEIIIELTEKVNKMLMDEIKSITKADIHITISVSRIPYEILQDEYFLAGDNFYHSPKEKVFMNDKNIVFSMLNGVYQSPYSKIKYTEEEAEKAFDLRRVTIKKH